MKTLIKTFYLILFFIVTTTHAQMKSIYVENYECIKTYLKLKGINGVEPDILIKEKWSNFHTLRIFNGDTGIVHSDENYSPKLYNKKHWEKLYKTYSNDTIVKYWKTEDFSPIDFIFGSQKKALYDGFLDMYTYSTKKIICLSEPMYYMDNKYVVFFYSKSSKGLYLYEENILVIMEKKKEKWIVIEEFYYPIYAM